MEWVRPNGNVLRFHIDLEIRVVVEPRLEFVDEPGEPPVQDERFGVGHLTPGHLQDVLNDVVHAHAVVLDNLGQAPVAFIEIGGLLEQLSRMAYGPQRVPDFVCNTRRESAECRQFELLGLTLDLSAVVDEDERVRLWVRRGQHREARE